MKTLAYLAGATALAAAFSSPAFAQSESMAGANATGITDVAEAQRDLERDVRDDFARSDDAYRFGTPDSRQGTFGSVALSYAGSTGNSENQDFSLSGRLSHNQGQFSQSVGILLEYGDNNAGEKDTEKTYVIYEGIITSTIASMPSLWAVWPPTRWPTIRSAFRAGKPSARWMAV